MSSKQKGILIGIAYTLFAVILLQNTQVVTFKILLWQVSMSRIILFPILVLIGFIAGYMVGKRSW